MTGAPPLPPAFERRIAAQLGEAAHAYFRALEQPPVRGLRLNPCKAPSALPEPLARDLGAQVPWTRDAYLLAADSVAGMHPLHEAGAYYLQEPSAMLPAAVLAARPGETVLDLCAAPGGKSTQLAADMAGQGTLVCNEPVPGRAQVLSRNLERMGVSNAAVVCAEPERLAQAWPLLFDAVLVDAPCSGEGMFRRHPEARLEWDEGTPERCARRQRRILESALLMLKPGGRLCYSTCTFSPEENEQTVSALLAAHPELSPIPFQAPLGGGRALDAPLGTLRLYPHQVAGEGHFVALLHKAALAAGEPGRPAGLLPPEQALAAAPRQATEAYAAFRQASACAPLPKANAALGDTLLCAPPLPPLQGLRVLRAGLHLGRAKGTLFTPDHALALAAPPLPLQAFPLTEPEARVYLRGETLPAPPGARGYGVVTCCGLALGFVKASDGQFKNHYPKGLRRP